MAGSIVVPVQVSVRVNQQQLNSVSGLITNIVNKSKSFSAKDFFAPITNSAKKLSKGLLGVKKNVGVLSNAFAGLKNIALGALSLTTLVRLSRELLKLSSDLIEVQNVVDTVFGDMADDINEFAKSALSSFGLTELQAKQFSSTIGAMIKAMGVSKDATLEMSEGITKLAGDVASFYNLDHEEAFTKLRSGISGETEPMKSLGVVMTQTNLEAYRLAQGIETSYSAMSQAEKVALRYNFMLDALSDAQGDFSKTQGSWSNQVRILTGQFQQLGSILGGLLQQVFYPILTVLNQILSLAISGASALAKMFGFDMESIQVNQGVSSGVVDSSGADAMEELADNTDDATAAQKKLNKEQKKSLANIHDLNVLSSNKSSGSSSGSGSGAGGSSGGAGGISFDLAKYKQVDPNSNPVSLMFNDLKSAIERHDWRGLGSLLADKVNSVFYGIDIAQYIPSVVSGVSAIAEALNGLTQNINFEEIGRVFGEGINLIVAAVNSFFDTFDFVSLGQQLARGFSSLVDTVDFTALGVFLTNSINALFQTIAGFVTTFDWTNLGLKFAEGINSIFSSFDFASASISIYGLINGVVETIGTTILNIDWASLGSNFATSFSTIFRNIDYGMILTTIILGISGLLTGISTFLAEIDWASIGDQLSTGFNQAISVLGNIDVGTIVSNLITGITNIISMLADFFRNVDFMSLGLTLYESVRTAILSVDWVGLITSIGELILNAFDAVCALALSIVLALVADVVTILWSISGKIAELLSNILALVSEGLGNIVGWVIAKVYELGSAIGTWISGLITNIGTWLSNVWTAISTWFTTLVTDIGTWLGNALTTLSNWFTSLPSTIGGWLSSIGSTISTWTSGIWSDFTGLLGDIVSYITGTFSSAWDKAWTGIKDVFSGIFGSIGGIFKGIINTVVDAINVVIDAINTISWDVPDWVPGIGGSTFGFDIPNVPKLANGAVIPPNQEFLAVLGDQRRGVNIETPLATMLDAFRLALADYGSADGGDIIIPIYINNELSSEEIIRRQDIARYRSNGK